VGNGVWNDDVIKLINHQLSIIKYSSNCKMSVYCNHLCV
jgi:hypothetical protein